MPKYKVIHYFKWGDLDLEPGQILIAQEKEGESVSISVEHYPEKTQLVHKKSVDGMRLLQKIADFDRF